MMGMCMDVNECEFDDACHTFETCVNTEGKNNRAYQRYSEFQSWTAGTSFQIGPILDPDFLFDILIVLDQNFQSVVRNFIWSGIRSGFPKGRKIWTGPKIHHNLAWSEI